MTRISAWCKHFPSSTPCEKKLHKIFTKKMPAHAIGWCLDSISGFYGLISMWMSWHILVNFEQTLFLKSYYLRQENFEFTHFLQTFPFLKMLSMFLFFWTTGKPCNKGEHWLQIGLFLVKLAMKPALKLTYFKRFVCISPEPRGLLTSSGDIERGHWPEMG